MADAPLKAGKNAKPRQNTSGTRTSACFLALAPDVQIPCEANAAPAVNGSWFYTSCASHSRYNQLNLSRRHRTPPAFFPCTILGREKHSAKGVWRNWLCVIKIKENQSSETASIDVSFTFLFINPCLCATDSSKNKQTRGKSSNENILNSNRTILCRLSCPCTGRTSVGGNGNFARADGKAFSLHHFSRKVFPLLCRYILMEGGKNNV